MAVVQLVLLFGSKMLVMTPRLEKSLKSFHNQAVQRMAEMVPKRQHDGTWVYTPIREALAMVGLKDIGVYISHRKNMVAQYIATRPIMDLCLAEDWKPGLCLPRRWWDHTALYILWIRAVHAAEEEGGETGTEE